MSCPVHSSKLIIETRYMRSNTYRHESDTEVYCDICRREINDRYVEFCDFIDEKDDDGNLLHTKIRCSICKEKGRR